MHGGKKDRDRMVSIALFSKGALSRKRLLTQLGMGEKEIDQNEQEIAEQNAQGIDPHGIGKGASPALTRGSKVGNPY